MARLAGNKPVSFFRLFWRMGGWAVLIPLALLLVLTAVSVVSLSTAERFEREGRQTTATVADKYFRENRDSDGDRTVAYFLVLDYTTNAGQTMNVHQSVGSALYNSASPGSTIPVWYLESAPSKIETSQGEHLTAARITQMIGLIFGAGFLGALWYFGRRAVAAVRARRFGIEETAEVLGIERTNTRVNNRYLYRLTWREGSGRTGKSLVYPREQLDHIKPGSNITIYQGLKRAWWAGDVGRRQP
ncbi:DUF3592 domain-containing protein [Mesobacterium sp. TK19101]|uniref:DUF3592 domain-containing protein n=1 Tax=Mesobacterium hydrothermale TaxID=3111907 RepID=A0ABU6HDA7_9RHOB|nr:DUF3592 domain-containing protein [Mesobacterium sp. TK19101]MEC3860443.1 DUF3592 domain-containing protein [Mesobacterium sp. TK19101]